MRKVLVVGLLGVLVVANLVGQVRAAENPANSLTFNPIGLLLQQPVGLYYERQLSPGRGLQVGVALMGLSIDDGWDSASLVGYGATVSYRFYANPTITGFYGGPMAGIAAVKLDTSTGLNADAISYGIGAVGGYKFVRGGFTVDLQVGALYTITSATGSYEGSVGTSSRNEINPMLALDIGFSW